MNEINWFFSNIKLIFSLREASSALPLLQMALKKKKKLNITINQNSLLLITFSAMC